MSKPSIRHLTRAIASALGLAALAALASPAAAQIDLSGEWAPRFFEDQPERVPGPDLGDFVGIPISDAARVELVKHAKVGLAL